MKSKSIERALWMGGLALSLSTSAIVPSLTYAQGTTVAGAIEEVLVTARRREESLQDVPIAITAVGTAQLEERSIESMEDLNKIAPNLMVAAAGVGGNANGAFSMRGIPGVAIYVDGVVHSGSQGALLDVVELERVEVLRGPQGTLFGKNAIGGAIQYVTQAPKDVFGARVKATIGQFDRIDLSANVDLPLVL